MLPSFFRKILAMGLLATLAFAWSTAWALEVPIVPSFSAGTAAKRLSAPTTPTPQVGGPGVAAAGHAPSAFPGAEKIRFKLSQIVLKGNTVYSTAELMTFFKPLLNREISLLELQNAVYEVTLKYRRDGYIISRALLPPQRIQNGVVQVQVIEGFVNEVTVAGVPGRVAPIVKALGTQAAQTRPLKLSELERYILLANNLPGVDVRSVLTPSPTTPGASELSLVTQYQAVQGYASYDNYGSHYLGPQQFSAGVNFNSIFTPGDTNAARAVMTSRNRELQFIQLIHAQPLGDKGAGWSTSGSYTETNPGFILEPFNIQGLSKTLQADIFYPVIRSRIQNLMVHSSAEYDDNSAAILGTPLYVDRMRYVTVGASYDRVDSLHGINAIKIDLQHGLDIIGANNSTDRSRALGIPDFAKLNMSMSRLQAIGTRFSALVAMQGQATSDILLAAQEFTFGGPDFGRGYDPVEIAGDQGIASKAELRMDTQPDLLLVKAIQYYAFYDVGVVWSNNPIDLVRHTSAASTGLGARIGFGKYLVGECYIAQPLTRPVAAAVAVGHNGKMPRGFFQIKMVF